MRAVPGLRVATLNIWGRQGPWEQRRAVIRAQLDALDVDLIGLQEVLRCESGATDADDQARELADGLGLPGVAYGRAMELGYGYAFGNAILSRYALGDVQNLALPSEPGSMPRALLSARARTPFGEVLFCSTHLAWKFDEGALRLRQAMAVAAAVDRRREGLSYPPILVGDFNAEPDADEIRFLRGLHVCNGVSTYFVDAFGEVGTGAGATFCRANEFARELDEPDRRIDYVFVRGREASGLGRPQHCGRAFDERREPAPGQLPIFASDHFGVFAELRTPEIDQNRAIREANA